MVLAALVAAPVPVSAHSGGGHCDFNGDGNDDAAIGSPGEDVAAQNAAGAVNVLYGSKDKLTVEGDQIWHQDTVGIDDIAEAGDGFGRAVECGDFDADGFDDLVVSSPFEDVGAIAGAGAINVIYGSEDGLTAVDDLYLHRGTLGIKGDPEAGDRFGWSLAVGDFDGDGHDDLAVGVTGDTAGGVVAAGSVHVIYGNSDGLSTRDMIWHRGKKGVKGPLQFASSFGHGLAAGDFDGDGYQDLAIGCYRDEVGGKADAGSVSVLYGSADGLSAAGDDLIHRDKKGFAGNAGNSDFFGWSVAAGDFDGDGYDELAVGAPLDTVQGIEFGGSVQVIPGSHNGLTPAGDLILHRNKAGVEGSVGYADWFGWQLTTGRFNSGMKDDLAVSVPFDDRAGLDDVGSVQVFYGSNKILNLDSDEIWHQDTDGIKGSAQEGDLFGFSISAGDFGPNSRDDLLIGIPNEDHGGHIDAGRALVIYGDSGGLSAAGDQTWSQDPLNGIVDDYDQFGQAVSGQAVHPT